ncbi:FOG: Transposon-encoded proteins with TYA, reverse transcriptase, integrase domains in various combinations [Ceraceosorus bombacis]|uniref:FOG: Transposon-encoded proteins with TYA, reverse transcriptase, integrase domains in various combinations n=1 Tax=Ceraceosorus bombacis TaxID=401625 RepID=A0A0N7LA99_9BASI|nr:FOG: Transposon-encoded proteins with TYA, reverse transcriptase, integrase domains in various combinations [Ceraceosorus bombacis]
MVASTPSTSRHDKPPPGPCPACNSTTWHWLVACPDAAAVKRYQDQKSSTRRPPKLNRPRANLASVSVHLLRGTTSGSHSDSSALPSPSGDFDYAYGWTALAETVVGLSAVGRGTDWYLDGGATQHMTGTYHHMAQGTPCSTLIQGIGAQVQATHRGKVPLTIDKDGAAVGVLLHDVLYAPELHINLISVPQLNLRGIQVLQDIPLSTLIDKVTKEVVGYVDYVNGQYKLRLLPNVLEPPTWAFVGASNSAQSLVRWHNRLNHVNADDIVRLMKHGHLILTDQHKEVGWPPILPRQALHLHIRR